MVPLIASCTSLSGRFSAFACSCSEALITNTDRPFRSDSRSFQSLPVLFWRGVFLSLAWWFRLVFVDCVGSQGYAWNALPSSYALGVRTDLVGSKTEARLLLVRFYYSVGAAPSPGLLPGRLATAARLTASSRTRAERERSSWRLMKAESNLSTNWGVTDANDSPLHPGA